MKLGIIDVGSNSVRLMLWADGISLYKKMCTTRLGEGINASSRLSPAAMERTAEAIQAFKLAAEQDGAEKVYAFATAAVRSADNGADFVKKVKKVAGLDLEVISGEKEAQIGLCGALGKGDGGIIDVGGASTEVTVRSGGKVIYSHSFDIGTVRVLDAAGRDLEKINAFIAERLSPFVGGDFSSYKICAVGGTATRLASIKRGVTVYSLDITDGTRLTAEEVKSFAEKLTATPVEEIKNTTICKNSADVIGGGAAILYGVMKKFAVGEITVSEKDNLEGYAIDKGNL